jgi:hypothetical protein
MIKDKWLWILLGILILSVILFYLYIIIPNWPYLYFPILKLLPAVTRNGQLITAIIIILMNFIAALITALIFSLPFGYITKERSFKFGLLLGLGLVLYLTWMQFHLYQEPWWSTFNTVVVISEYIGIILAFVIMSKTGSYIKCHRERKAR